MRAKYTEVLEDEDVNRCCDKVAAKSIVTATVYPNAITSKSFSLGEAREWVKRGGDVKA